MLRNWGGGYSFGVPGGAWPKIRSPNSCSWNAYLVCGKTLYQKLSMVFANGSNFYRTIQKVTSLKSENHTCTLMKQCTQLGWPMPDQPDQFCPIWVTLYTCVQTLSRLLFSKALLILNHVIIAFFFKNFSS